MCTKYGLQPNIYIYTICTLHTIHPRPSAVCADDAGLSAKTRKLWYFRTIARTTRTRHKRERDNNPDKQRTRVAAVVDLVANQTESYLDKEMGMCVTL